MSSKGSENLVAIIGMGSRFPGSRGPDEFWEFLCEGGDAIREVPSDRWDAEAFYDPVPATPGKINNSWGGFLEDVDGFDADFFHVSPREAARTDPQQRILLEVAWEALEDAGIPAERLAGSRTGVFVGVHFSDYECIRAADPFDNDLYSFRGTARSVVAGRLSHALATQGPSMVVDAACSSSLVAVHLACRSLRQGESELALAAGANLLLDPGISIAFSRGNMLSPDGRCKAFDASADGFVRSDGFGVVVLKPLDRALADGDRVYAVIRGSAVNNDGQTGAAPGAPGREGQEQVLRAAYADADVPPALVHHVEAHGTGTAVGDPVELTALAAVLGEGRPPERPLRVGSVKTNIGHTEGAAGIAGLIKTALSLRARVVPPSLHCKTPTPAVPWDRLPIRVQRELESWPQDAPAFAGVSSFGITGTNAHVVLEAAPAGVGASTGHEPTDGLVLPVSARSRRALREAVGLLERTLAGAAERGTPSAADVCLAAATRRGHHPHRALFVGASPEELRAALTDFAQERTRPGTVSGRIPARHGRVAFVFSGQGSEWPGMCSGLMETHPVFRESMRRCDRVLSKWTRRSVLDLAEGRDLPSGTWPIDLLQPLLFAVQVSLVELWRSWGIAPDAVIGHSMGEVAAAHAAGLLSLEDAGRVICARSRLMHTTSGRGGMVVVGLAPEAARVLAGAYGDRVAVAAVNGPSTSVLSGDAEVVDRIAADLAEGGETFCRRIDIEVAAHSPHMDELRAALRAEIADIAPMATDTVEFRSTADPDAAVLDADYWTRNLREPVQFWPAVERLLADGHDTFVEISPHPVLLGAIGQGSGPDAATLLLPSMRRDEGLETAHGTLARLYVAGHDPDWAALCPGTGSAADVRLPLYPWQSVRFPHQGAEEAAQRPRAGAGHSLLGDRLPLAAHPGTRFWESRPDVRVTPYLADHQVEGVAVFPAAGYAAMALAATSGHDLADLAFTAALGLSARRSARVQFVLTGTGSDQAFQVFGDQGDGAWVLHATGRVRAPARGPVEETPDAAVPPDAVEVPREDFYRGWAERGLRYGPRFQRLAAVWRSAGEGEAWARLSAPEEGDRTAETHGAHPVLLDACFQTVLAALPEDGALYLPVGLGGLRLHGPLTDGCTAHARLRDGAADLEVRDPGGRLVLEAKDLRMQRLERRRTAPDGQDLRFEQIWVSVPAPERTATTPRRRLLVLDGSGGALPRALAERGAACVRVEPAEGFARLGPGHYRVDPGSPADFERLVRETDAARLDGVVHAWALLPGPEENQGENGLPGMLRTSGPAALHLVQALTKDSGTPPRLWIATAGAVATGPGEPADPAQAALWGFGRTVMNEHPELECTLVDLDLADSAGLGAFAAELDAADEDQTAWRDGARYAARLRPRPHGERGAEPLKAANSAGPPGRFRLEMPGPGPLDRMRMVCVPARPPGEGEVEIEVEVAALNFKDVLRAMGMLRVGLSGPLPLGIECAGTVSAVGPGVPGLAVGQRVVAVTDSSRGCAASHVHADARTVVPVPEGVGLREAVTVPVAFLTAHYALDRLAWMAAGDRVLVHAASGGVGLAAVQLALAAGAEVHATAGSEDKRAYLRETFGLDRVMDSRSVAFADEVRARTGGSGVDIVLNSLSGEAIEAGLSALAPGGRFVELGKRDIEENAQLGLSPFGKGLSFSSLDVEALLLDRPAEVGSALRGLMDRLARGELRPLPYESFPVHAAEDAFRRLALARHIGKVLISMAPREREPGARPAAVRPDAAYLITGGLGALGMGTAAMLAEAGARHLVLVTRRPPSDAGEEGLVRLRAAGAAVTVVTADVSRYRDLADAVGSALAGGPPLRGVVHAAGTLADGTVAQLDWADFETVAASKVEGSWNLHRFTKELDLDFFVMFSSVAGVLGNPGQANYAAANSAMDALAHLRRARGLPALSIAWGPWAEVGLAARPDRGGRLDTRGLPSLRPAEGFVALAREIAGDGREPAQVMVSRFEPARWAGVLPSTARTSLLRDLLVEPNADPGTGAAEGPRLGDALLGAAPGARAGMLADHVRREIARITRTDPRSLDAEASVTAMGIDSLMAMELRQALEASVGVTVSTARLLKGVTLTELADELSGLLAEPVPRMPTGPAPTAAAGLADQVDGLSDAEVDALLGQLLTEGETPA